MDITDVFYTFSKMLYKALRKLTAENGNFCGKVAGAKFTGWLQLLQMPLAPH